MLVLVYLLSCTMSIVLMFIHLHWLLYIADIATVILLGHCICTFNISARVLRLFHGKAFGLVLGIKLNHNYMSCQQVVTVTSCLVYKVVRDF